MENKLLKKLQIKPGFKLQLGNAPENADAILGDVSEIELLQATGNRFDALLLFVKNSAELNNALEIWASRMKKKVVWIAYPKKSSGIESDLKMEKWDALALYQLTPCASAALDEVWTALRIKFADEVRPSGVGNAEIKINEFADFIDVENRKITAPPDLMKLLLQHPQALGLFDALAYSHKKEYVLWILTAKQDKTRQDRLEKTVEKLLAGKKNPSAK